ncbi:GNAT family N-acetyltransferase [Candidimonas nitroreducens]|uniref:GNAT family N-acetyltransferase n=1 Tax=Candidimonas nitroreducens TaxID=683354 RepID=A0A225MQ67_9BURK|nr:GNAT family N-acetyltransferase [Candidimonas nitroreducens]OWT62070.1 GNAT family N-acetyltransferase [Candidimonas nitroreducens]
MNQAHSNDSPREAAAIRHAETEQELRACFPVMHELRPQLTDEEDLLQRIQRMRGQGYQLLAAWRGHKPLALAGYRLQENLIYGRFLYVDDLIVTQASRGQRLGAQLLQYLRAQAHKAGCDALVLDTALSNALGQRFYFRQGLLTRAIRFSVPVAETA